MSRTTGFVARRDVVRGAGAVAVAGIAGCSGLARAPGHADGPPATEHSGWLESRYTGARMGWTVTVPAGQRFPHQARFRPGGHNAAYWRKVAPWQLSAIGRELGLP